MNNEQVWSEQVRSLVMRTIPYADQITHIELHKDGIRFTWKKNRFQVIYISNNIWEQGRELSKGEDSDFQKTK